MFEKLRDRFQPFYDDAECRLYYWREKYEPENVIRRKRDAFREALWRDGTNKDVLNALTVHTRILHDHERKKRRWEFIKEAREWVALGYSVGGFVAGVIAAPWIRGLW